MYKKTFGKNLKALLVVRNLNQVQIAKALDVSEAMVSKYVSGENFPLGEQLCKLADILDVSLDALVGRRKLVIVENQRDEEEVVKKSE